MFCNLTGAFIYASSDNTETTETIEKVAKQAEEEVSLLKEYANNLLDWLVSKAGSILIAFIFMIICFKLVKVVLKILKKSFEKSKLEQSVAGFFMSAIRIVLYVLIFITAATIMGFQVTSFVTLLGSAGVTLGLALQGSLSNLAGGILILILKPFKVDDYIIENNTGCEGTVTSIDIFYTKLITVDNKVVVIPNGSISNTSLINVTKNNTRRVDISLSVGYEEDMSRVRDITISAVKKVEWIVPDGSVDFFIDEFADSGINICVRFVCEMEHYFDAKWAAMWNIKEMYDKNGIVIPYNKLDVSISK